MPSTSDVELKAGDAPRRVQLTLTPLPGKTGEIDRLLGRLEMAPRP